MIVHAIGHRLSVRMQRTARDETNLNGFWDFHRNWRKNQAPPDFLVQPPRLA